MDRIKIAEELLKVAKDIMSMPHGKDGYFPPMGADRPVPAPADAPEIYKGSAMSVAKKLKQVIEAANKDKVLKGQSFFAPVVNYAQGGSGGPLVLGVAASSIGPMPSPEEHKIINAARKKYLDKAESIVKSASSGARVYDDYHRGISGSYKGTRWKSAIVIAVQTPGQMFNDNTASKLMGVF